MNARGEYGAHSDKLSGSPRVAALLTDVGPYRPRRGSGLGRGSLAVGLDPLELFSPTTAALIKKDLPAYTSVEVSNAVKAADEAVAPLVQQRLAMLHDWKPDNKLSRDQMTTIMNTALGTARQCEQQILTMIAKVPSHWETYLRNDLSVLQRALAEVPHFQTLVSETKTAATVPGFRDWIDHLLSRTEDGMTTISAISIVIPNWLALRELLTVLYQGAVAAIHAVVMIIEGAGKVIKSTFDIFKWLEEHAKYLLIGGGVLAAGLLTVSVVKKVRS